MSVLNGLPARNVIPSYIEDVNESAWYVIEDAEKTYNEMVQGLAINELHVLESTGAVILNEDANEKTKFSLVEWLKKGWQAVKGFFERIFKLVSEKIASIKAKHFTKIDKNKIKKYIDSLDPKDKNGNDRIFGEYYQYTNLDAVNDGGAIWTQLKKYNAAIDRCFNDFKMSNKSDETKQYIANIQNDMMDAKEELNNTLKLGKDSAEANIQKAVKNYIRGEQVKMDLAFVKTHIDDMINSATNPKAIIDKTKKMYNDIKKDYDNTIKFVNQNRKDKDPQAYTVYMPFLKYGKNVSTQIASAALNCTKEKIMADLKVVMRLQAAINKSFNESAVVEEGSTVVESSTYSKELRTLFNF